MGVGKMLAAAVGIWGILAFMSHGSGILIYISIQLVTTGLFVFMFCKAEKAYGESSPKDSGLSEKNETAAMHTKRSFAAETTTT